MRGSLPPKRESAQVHQPPLQDQARSGQTQNESKNVLRFHSLALLNSAHDLEPALNEPSAPCNSGDPRTQLPGLRQGGLHSLRSLPRYYKNRTSPPEERQNIGKDSQDAHLPSSPMAATVRTSRGCKRNPAPLLQSTNQKHPRPACRAPMVANHTEVLNTRGRETPSHSQLSSAG